jgi:sensor histidine kinase YesM
MKALLDAFCHYLQTSFDFKNSSQTVPLEHELELVRSYLFIMNERFPHRFDVLWEVDESIGDIQLPPLTIQPLIENALNHGILKRSSKGMIQIQLKNDGEYFEVVVSDNGVGINDEKTLHELMKNKRRKEGGIGLFNTNRRLKQLYGHGLQIESKPNQGTKISFHVPIIHKETSGSQLANVSR